MIVPAGQVAWIAEDEIRIEGDRAALEALLPYHPAPGDERMVEIAGAAETAGEDVARIATEAPAHEAGTP